MQRPNTTAEALQTATGSLLVLQNELHDVDHERTSWHTGRD